MSSLVLCDRPKSQQITLRDYQQEIVDQIYLNSAAGMLRILLFSPTGAGKTAIACKLIVDFTELGKPSLFVVRQEPLIHQTVRTLQRMGIECGVIKAGFKPDYTKLVQVATIQTLNRRSFPPAALIIVDEAHGTCAAQYDRLFDHYHDALIVGPTATPFRLSKKETLKSRFDALVGSLQTSDLIERGFLVPIRVFSNDLDLSSVATVAGEFDQGALRVVMDTPEMVQWLVTEYQQKTPGERAIAFAVNIEHSQNIVSAFNAAGIPAEHIDGETPPAERQALYSRLRHGPTRLLSSVGVLSEGFDEPSASVCLMARPTQSRGLFMQQVGRVLRLSPDTNKTKAVLIDQAGNCFRFGLPTDRINLSLTDPPPDTEPGEAPVKLCPECESLIHASLMTCPECGYEYPVHAVAPMGVMVELTPSGFKDTLDNLLAVAKSKGYKKAWVYHEVLRQWPKPSLDELSLIQDALEYGAGWIYYQYLKLNPEVGDLIMDLSQCEHWAELQSYSDRPAEHKRTAWALLPDEQRAKLKAIAENKETVVLNWTNLSQLNAYTHRLNDHQLNAWWDALSPTAKRHVKSLVPKRKP